MYKKIIKAIIFVLVFFVLGLCLGYLYKHNKPTDIPKDFSIHQSFIMGSDNYKSTRLKVIVKVKEYDVEDMYNKIIEHHRKLNGMSDTLYIELFNSMDDFIEYNVASERNYKRINNTKDYVIDN